MTTPPTPAPRLWAMLPTPFSEDARAIDYLSLARLVHWYRHARCDGIVALGVIAEPSALTSDERAQVLETLIGLTDSPIVAGIVSTDHREVMTRAHREVSPFAPRLSAVMVDVSSNDPGVLRSRLNEIHEVTGLPVIVQDHPEASRVHIPITELAVALEGLPFVEAVKCDATPTPLRIQRLRELAAVAAIAGRGGIGLVDDYLAGASSVACGMSRPDLLADALACLAAGDVDAADSIVSRVSALIWFETQGATAIAVRKEHLRRAGVMASAAVRSAAPYPSSYDVISRRHGYR